MIEIELGGKQVQLLTREVIERNRLRYVEWRQLRLRDQADGITLTQQYEGQAREIGVGRPRVVGRTNTRQQLVGIGKIFNALNFIDENDDRFSHELQNDFGIELEKSLAVAQD